MDLFIDLQIEIFEIILDLAHSHKCLIQIAHDRLVGAVKIRLLEPVTADRFIYEVFPADGSVLRSAADLVTEIDHFTSISKSSAVPLSVHTSQHILQRRRLSICLFRQLAVQFAVQGLNVIPEYFFEQLRFIIIDHDHVPSESAVKSRILFLHFLHRFFIPGHDQAEVSAGIRHR